MGECYGCWMMGVELWVFLFSFILAHSSFFPLSVQLLYCATIVGKCYEMHDAVHLGVGRFLNSFLLNLKI